MICDTKCNVCNITTRMYISKVEVNYGIDREGPYGFGDLGGGGEHVETPEVQQQ